MLSAAEMSALHSWVDDQRWLDEDARAELVPWLDAGAPPSPTEVGALAQRARALAPEDVAGATRSLTDLGLALARAAGSDALSSDDAVEDLRGLEAALGVVGTDAARRVLGASLSPHPRPAPPAFDAVTLRAFLDQDHRELRDELLEGMGREPLRIPPGLPMDEHRARTLAALRHLAGRGYGAIAYPEAHGGRGEPSASVAAFETLAYGDLSLTVKYGVQFGLFGGSVLQLGTRAHHERYLSRIASLDLPGCYAMTETGHGSNVRDLETTATYDPDTDELVIHTPHADAGKDWIGNAARDGRIATVFARLIVAGEDHGVHAMLVPLRDEHGRPLPGVRIEDRGLKEGLNGVDNGRIWFDGVRVPRADLLDRFGAIDDEGRYRSPIPSSGKRFFTMLGTLVMGRISIAAASVSAAKTGLTIAVRHGARRLQFGPEGEGEVPLLDHRMIQRALMPALATTYGLHLAVHDLVRHVPSGSDDEGGELEVRAAALKAYASDHCVATLQACREACGGVGYLAANRFGSLKADTDVFTTFEGANAVLLQLVAKGLLLRFRHEMGDLRLWGMVRYLADRAGETLVSLNPVVTRRADEEHLRDPDFQQGALLYREERLLRSVAQRLTRRLDEGLDSFRAIDACQDHLVALARAHAERIVFEALEDGVARAPSPGLSESLRTLGSLHALSRIEAHRGWYLETGYLEPGKSRAIRHQVNALCAEVREYAALLVDAFGIPDAVLMAPAGLVGAD
jgi:acyl-CoA oxidase